MAFNLHSEQGAVPEEAAHRTPGSGAGEEMPRDGGDEPTLRRAGMEE